MRYSPDWESLSQVLARFVSVGADEKMVKTDLCNAIADQKIKLRAFLADDDEDLPGASFSGKEIGVPKRLKPKDFDWEQSVPVKDWFAGDPSNIRIGWERRKFTLLELQTAQMKQAVHLNDEQAAPAPLRDLENYSKWVAFQDASWQPPSSLEYALRKIQDLPVVWLNQAVDVMAFGNEEPAIDPLEYAARRCQASRELCQAARKDLVQAIGSPDRPGDGSDPISRSYFDISRQLGSADNSIQTALDKVTDEDFTAAQGGGHKKWFNVRIETRSLLDWLRGFVPSRGLEFPVEPYMIASMTAPDAAGYVPFCSALLWIMTKGGAIKGTLQDKEAWTAAVARLLPLMATGEVEVIGRPANGAPEVITGSVFAGILVSDPLYDSTGTLTGENPWISPTPYIDDKHWRDSFNDQLFLYKATPATWTQLQVKKSDVLREIAICGAGSPAGNASPPPAISLNLSGRGKMERAIHRATGELFPNGIPEGMSSQSRNDNIREKIRGMPGVSALPTDRTIQKAIKNMGSRR